MVGHHVAILMSAVKLLSANCVKCSAPASISVTLEDLEV